MPTPTVETFTVTWQTDPPQYAVRHALLWLKGGSIAPGRYSPVNHCWQVWTGGEYVVVWPVGWCDLVKVEQ